MFNSLSERLSKTLQSMGKKARLTEDNIASTLKEVRKALLEADVALLVVKKFISQVRTRALGREVRASLTPGQQFLKVVQSELEAVLGGPSESLNLAQRPPAIVLLAGLQGAGKTTTAAKLAKFLTNREKKKVLLVSVDVYRPAAMEQLATLGAQIAVDVFPSTPDKNPIALAQAALQKAESAAYDVLLVDTAGRLGIDEEMMKEKFGRDLKKEKYEYGFDVEFEVESYLRYQADAFSEKFNAHTYLLMTKALDYFDPSRDYENDLTKTLEKTNTDFLVLSFSSDWRFAPERSKEIVNALIASKKPVSYAEIKSSQGHDGFLFPDERYVKSIQTFLKNE